MPTSPTPADRPTEELAATIETVLRESLPVWWQTPPRLDWAALAVARQLLGTTVCPECRDTGACNGGPCPLAADAAAALGDGAVRCPLCPSPLMLHTPSGARAHFAHVHPEQQISGHQGPWPVLAAAAPPAPADRAAVLREAADIAESLCELTPAYGARKAAQISENVGVLRVADHFRALAAGAAPALRCPRCNEDLTDYTDEDRVYRTGDTRPYCSGECVVFAYRRKLPIPSWAADAADAAAGVQPPTSEAHHTVGGTHYLCHTDDHYCPIPPAAPAAPEEQR